MHGVLIMEIKEKVVEILKEVVNRTIPDNWLELGGQLQELSIDSLEYIKIVVRFENTFDVEFDDEALDLTKFSNVDDICAYITKLIEVE
jgi:acyl carrier protein